MLCGSERQSRHPPFPRRKVFMDDRGHMVMFFLVLLEKRPFGADVAPTPQARSSLPFQSTARVVNIIMLSFRAMKECNPVHGLAPFALNSTFAGCLQRALGCRSEQLLLRRNGDVRNTRPGCNWPLSSCRLELRIGRCLVTGDRLQFILNGTLCSRRF